jgi:serine/threonine protein kinase
MIGPIIHETSNAVIYQADLVDGDEPPDIPGLPKAAKFAFKHIRDECTHEIEVNRALAKCSCVAAGFEFSVAPGRTGFFMVRFLRGDLFDVRGLTPFTEGAIQLMVRRVLRALRDIHALGYVHRDVKSENILLDDSPLNPKSFLCDFGLSAPLPADGFFRQRVGTSRYFAPELILSNPCRYDASVDMWALGIVIFEVYTRLVPFGDPDTGPKEFYEERLNYFGENLRFVETAECRSDLEHCLDALDPPASEDARDLIFGLLRFDSRDRLTAAQALEHPFCWGVVDDEEVCDVNAQGGEPGRGFDMPATEFH